MSNNRDLVLLIIYQGETGSKKENNNSIVKCYRGIRVRGIRSCSKLDLDCKKLIGEVRMT